MAWQLIFKAPDADSDGWPPRPEEPAPTRKPVSMTLQLDPGTMVVVPGGADEDDDD